MKICIIRDIKLFTHRFPSQVTCAANFLRNNRNNYYCSLKLSQRWEKPFDIKSDISVESLSVYKVSSEY